MPNRTPENTKETVMNRIRRIRRVITALAGLAVTWLSLAVAAPAAFAATTMVPNDGGTSGRVRTGAVTVTRTVVVGGTPGWQIALIAVGAALFAAGLAVLAERTRMAHRKAALSAA
jgi:hypothetical protein